MSAKTYVVDSGGTTRFLKRVYIVDSGNVTRKVKRIWAVDNTNTARLVFTGADYLTLIAGVTFGETGYTQGGFGSLTPSVLGDGSTVTSLFTTPTTPPQQELFFVITGYPGTVTSSYLTSLTINGATMPATAATFSGGGAGSQAEWTWTPSTALVGGTTYPVVVQRT